MLIQFTDVYGNEITVRESEVTYISKSKFEQPLGQDQITEGFEIGLRDTNCFFASLEEGDKIIKAWGEVEEAVKEKES